MNGLAHSKLEQETESRIDSKLSQNPKIVIDCHSVELGDKYIVSGL